MAPWIAGLGLFQIGEFSFVLARSGLGADLLSKATYDLALTCTILTMTLSPLVSSARGASTLRFASITSPSCTNWGSTLRFSRSSKAVWRWFVQGARPAPPSPFRCHRSSDNRRDRAA